MCLLLLPLPSPSSVRNGISPLGASVSLSPPRVRLFPFPLLSFNDCIYTLLLPSAISSKNEVLLSVAFAEELSWFDELLLGLSPNFCFFFFLFREQVRTMVQKRILIPIIAVSPRLPMIAASPFRLYQGFSLTWMLYFHFPANSIGIAL